MSGIAEVMVTLGYQVSGSDQSDSRATQRLQAMGATIFRGHAPSNIEGADVVVVSSAIKADNVERQAARAQRIPVVPRAEMLAELMRFKRGIAIAGTHGKTTTTSLTASVLREGGMDPTFVIGGQLLSAGANAQLGSGQWLVAEADESDGSFLRLNPLVAVVTNIEADHLENYGGDFNRVKQAFSEFLHRLPFYGLAVLCIEDAEVRALAEQMPRHCITYGFVDAADVRASAVTQVGGQMHFSMHLPDGKTQDVVLNLPGRHNVLNALAAAAIAWQLGVSRENIAAALLKFEGIGRRFNIKGELALKQGSALLVDDYGHHPSELAAVFAAARGGWPDKRLVVAFQPHRYSRTRDLFDEFTAVLSSADAVVLTDVYAAGEAPVLGADAKSLARSIRARGRLDPVVAGPAKELPRMLGDVLKDGDLLLMMGAGDIGAVCNELAQHGLILEKKQ
ncbi:MAG: UDP-N-acetylmuramate--L-alanine ligase [Arenimonas sp.]|nr:UDP-N-acetylmuramate--L-alanine ligase [Arenimonas sp.]